MPVLSLLATLHLAAFAADAVLLPPPPVHGDGETAAILQVVSASAAAKVRIRASEGRILDQTPVQGGVVVRWLPPAVDAPRDVEILLRAKGEKTDTVTKVRVVPGYRGKLDVRPDVVIVDPGATTTVRFRPSGPTAQAADQRRLLVSTNLGTLGPLTVDPQGGWLATFTPPAGLSAPARAIVVATDAAAPGEILGATVIALTSPKDVTVQAVPGSTNTVDIGGRLFGPVVASPAGTASFDVKLHPDHPTGTLTSKKPDGSTAVSDVPMPVAAPTAITIAPLPLKIPADTPLPVFVFCRDPAGKPCDPSTAAATAPGGTATPPATSGDAWTITFAAPEGAASLTVKAGGTTSSWSGTGVTGSANMELVPTPAAVPSGKTDFVVEARLKTAAGAADPGRTPVLEAKGATVVSKPKDKRDGSYTASFRLDKAAPYARVVGAAIGQPTGLPARRMVAWPTQVSTAADGKSTAMVVIAVEDALGAPIADVPLTLAVPIGDATVPPTAKTGRDGLARVEVRAGTRNGVVAVTISGGGLGATATLWQDSAGKPADLVALGSEDDLGAIRRWQDRVPATFVGRASSPAVAQRPKEAPPTMGTAPPTLGAPPVTSGTTGAAVSAPSVTKAPHVVGEPSRMRLRATLFDRPGTGVVVPGGAFGADFAPEATWAVSPLLGSVGAHVDAEAWALRERKLGFDLRARAFGYRLQVGDKAPLQLPLDVEGGVRWRLLNTGSFSVAPGIGASYLTGQAIVYADPGRTRAEVRAFGISAARLEAVARYENESTLFQVELEGVFSPRPTLARAEAMLDVGLSGPIVFTAALGADMRWFRLEAEDDVDARVDVRQFSQELRLGIGVVAF